MRRRRPRGVQSRGASGPDQRVRRDRRVQLRGHGGDGEGDQRVPLADGRRDADVLRDRHRAGVHGGGPRDAQGQVQEPAHPGGEAADAVEHAQAGGRRVAPAADRLAAPRGHRVHDRVQDAADAGSDRGAQVRVEVRQARQVQRDHGRDEGAPARDGQRAAEPRELRADRAREERRGDGRERARVGCVFPLRVGRLSGEGVPGGREGDRASGREHARSGRGGLLR
mmetsp:Transcript_14419/g.51895  ORF Transcript_14419/g.51895 Transcript_14419/m.51895 type:complete len:225 (+) Transcript_14419:1058-1732(+)